MRAFFVCLFLASSVIAADYPAPVEHDFIVRNYRFASGETLPEVRIHYATIGTQRPGNGVLVLHGTGGTLNQFLNDRFGGVLFKAGGVLDASRYFIVIPDNIGHGKSSKPSDGLGKKFPHYDYDDMVDLQHRLITEDLHIDHLALVMGTSMGGMQTWMWGEKWPQMMDRLVPLASAPTQIAGRNRMWRRMMIDDLNRGDLESALQLLLLVGSAPLQWQASGPTRDAADAWIEEQMKARRATNNIDDLLYAVESSRNYDPSPQLERIAVPLLAINSADDFINPPELGIMEKLMPRVKHGRYLLIPTSDQTHGHGTHTWAAIWEKDLAMFLRMNDRGTYQVWVPEGLQKPAPVILFLHGAGERGTDNIQQTVVGIGAALRDHPERVPAIVVMPQVPPDERWLGEPADAAMRALDAAIAEFGGDRSRVYLTGLSMGGYGTWHLALAHPDRFAAIVPICGGLLPHQTTNSVRQSPLTAGASDPYAFTANALRAMPVWIFHGASDATVPVTESRQMADALRAAGASDVHYTEYPNVGHNSWDRAYGDEEMWHWMFRKRR
jgi:homoserine O-acetyltransferase